MNKTQLLELLSSHLQTVSTCSGLHARSRQEDLIPAIRHLMQSGRSAEIRGPDFEVQQFSESMDRIYMMTVRAALVELFENTRAYCRISRQESKLMDQDWYQPIRLVCGALVNDSVFEFMSYELSILPVRWATLVVGASDHGQPVDIDKIGPQVVLEWLHALEIFIRFRLN